jgi:hypothetical protein
MSTEAILAAAWAQASPAPLWVTTSRKLAHWHDVSGASRPALFQALNRIDAAPLDAVTSLTIWLDYYVYITHTDPEGPQAQLAAAIDTLRAAFTPAPGFESVTLGGLVAEASVMGTIQTDEGTLGRDAVAIVPVRLLVG